MAAFEENAHDLMRVGGGRGDRPRDAGAEHVIERVRPQQHHELEEAPLPPNGVGRPGGRSNRGASRGVGPPAALQARQTHRRVLGRHATRPRIHTLGSAAAAGDLEPDRGPGVRWGGTRGAVQTDGGSGPAARSPRTRRTMPSGPRARLGSRPRSRGGRSGSRPGSGRCCAPDRPEPRPMVSGTRGRGRPAPGAWRGRAPPLGWGRRWPCSGTSCRACPTGRRALPGLVLARRARRLLSSRPVGRV